jgi:predicted RecA/RadA family phage recombinase
MKNYIQRGDTLTLLAPYNVASGAGFVVGAIFAIAACTVLAGSPVEGVREGVFTLPKTSAQAWTQGDKIYWDDVNKRCDSDSTVGLLIGAAGENATNPSAEGVVVLTASIPSSSEGPQAAIPDVVTANGTDLATTQALANSLKATLNTLLGELRTHGVLKP